MEGKMNSGDAHLAVNYQKLLQFGLRGFEERARKAKAALDLTDPASIDKYHFYDSIFIVIDAIKVYANRFVALAKNLAENANPKRKKELLEMQIFALESHMNRQLLLQKLFNQFGLFNVFYKLNLMATLFHMVVLINICIHI